MYVLLNLILKQHYKPLQIDTFESSFLYDSPSNVLMESNLLDTPTLCYQNVVLLVEHYT